MTSRAPPDASAEPELDRLTLRALVLHLLAVARCYELRDPGAQDENATAMLRDVAKRIARHRKPLEREDAKAIARFLYEDIHAFYWEYLRDPSMTREALRDLIEGHLGSRYQLTPWQLDRAAPTREALAAYGPSQLAKDILGEFVFHITGRQLHDWKEEEARYRPPPAFNVSVDGPELVKYVIEALEPNTGRFSRREEEEVLRRTLAALEQATAARAAALEKLVAEWRAGAQPGSDASASQDPSPESGPRTPK